MNIARNYNSSRAYGQNYKTNVNHEERFTSRMHSGSSSAYDLPKVSKLESYDSKNELPENNYQLNKLPRLKLANVRSHK